MLSWIYLIAITAEAMSGALSAGKRRMDLFGVVTIASVTALGGGSLRDIVLGHYPLGWVRHPQYLLFTIGAAIFATVAARWMHRLRHAFLLLDALGLVAFTVIGCTIARDAGHSMVIAVVAGTLTGTFGGVLRDVLCNEIPLLFRKELYAIVSLLTGATYLALLHFQVPAAWATSGCIIGGFVLRVLAIRHNWEVPKFVYRDELH